QLQTHQLPDVPLDLGGAHPQLARERLLPREALPVPAGVLAQAAVTELGAGLHFRAFCEPVGDEAAEESLVRVDEHGGTVADLGGGGSARLLGLQCIDSSGSTPAVSWATGAGAS